MPEWGGGVGGWRLADAAVMKEGVDWTRVWTGVDWDKAVGQRLGVSMDSVCETWRCGRWRGRMDMGFMLNG